MASWHKRVRLGVAIFGLAIATIVYFALRDRHVAPAPQPVSRLDPSAVLEISQALVDSITGTEKNFEIVSKWSQQFADGSTKHLELIITVPKGENRTFKVTANEAVANKDQTRIQLTGNVRLEDSDGFFLTTDAATYDRPQSVAKTTGAVAFGKGRMSGSGVGITYEQANDVLVISEQAQVTTRNESDEPVMQFTGGAATLDRLQNRLTVENSVHVIRNEETIDTDRAVATLSDEDDVVRFLELRGNSRVAGGGGGIDAMSARDINLDYTDDGQRLEAVSLDGTAAVARKGENGTSQQIVSERVDLQLAADSSSRMNLKGKAVVTMAGEGGREGRKIAADSLELDVAADGTLTRAVGRDNVRLDLPAAQDAPGRSIVASSLDGTGKAGVGLTDATFTGDVVFTEAVGRSGGAAAAPNATARTARARMLRASMANDAVTAATFTTDVTFEEAGLKACAARLEYQPEKGSLTLSGDTAAGKPIVVEERIAIEAPSIDAALDSRRMRAKGGVTMQVSTASRCRPAVARPQTEQGPSRLPGLLQQDAAATITAAALDYEGDAGKAVFTGGRPSISQANTTIYGDTIALDQKNGDLTATGNAIATLMLDGESSTGRAHEIVYVDAKRLIRYTAPPPSAVPIAAPVPGGRGAPAAREPLQVIGPQGNLLASSWINVVLAEKGRDVTRIEASGNVRMEQGQRKASGADRMTYDAATGTYVMTAGATAPVVLVADCRENRGKKLTFYKANDTIEIDGERERRVQTGNAGGRCVPASPTP